MIGNFNEYVATRILARSVYEIFLKRVFENLHLVVFFAHCCRAMAGFGGT